MKKTILRTALAFLTASLALACVTDPEGHHGPHLLGYSLGTRMGACNEATPTHGYWESWEISRDSLGQDRFCIYGKGSDLEAGMLGTRTRSALQAGDGRRLLDASDRGGCLTFDQDGKDTVQISGKTVIVEVPIEPCFPFALHPTQ